MRRSCCPDDYDELRCMISVLSAADLRLYSRRYRGHVHRLSPGFGPLRKPMCHACCSHMCYALSHQYHAAVLLSLLQSSHYLRGRVHLFWPIYTIFVSSIKYILTKLCTRTKVCSNCLHKFNVLCMFGPFLIYLCIVMVCF